MFLRNFRKFYVKNSQYLAEYEREILLAYEGIHTLHRRNLNFVSVRVGYTAFVKSVTCRPRLAKHGVSVTFKPRREHIHLGFGVNPEVDMCIAQLPPAVYGTGVCGVHVRSPHYFKLRAAVKRYEIHFKPGSRVVVHLV